MALELDEKKKILLGVAAVCTTLVVIALVWICCCACRKKRHHLYGWRKNYSESSPGYIHDKGTRHYNDYSTKRWGASSFRGGDEYNAVDNKGRRSGFFSKVRHHFGTDKRLPDRQEIVKGNGVDKSYNFRQTHRYSDGDKKSVGRQEMTRSKGTYDYVTPRAEYRRTRRFSDSDADKLSIDRRDFVTSRRNSDDYKQPLTGYRRRRRYSGSFLYTTGHHRPKHEHIYDSRPKHEHIYDSRPKHEHIYDSRPKHEHIYDSRPKHEHIYDSRPKHEHIYDSRPKHDHSTAYKQRYDVTGADDVRQQRYDREPIVIKYNPVKHEHSLPVAKYSHNVNFRHTRPNVQYNDQLLPGYAHSEVVQYTGPPRILEPIYYTQPQQQSYLSNPRYTESRYLGATALRSNGESNIRIDPLLQTAITQYLAQTLNGNGLTQNLNGNGLTHTLNGNGLTHTLNGNGLTHTLNGNGLTHTLNGNGLKHTLNGNGLVYAGRTLPAAGIVDVDADRLRNGRLLGTTVQGYGDGQFEATSVNPSTSYFFGRQDYQQESRPGTNERQPNHVLYHGHGQTTDMFEDAQQNPELFNKN